MSYRTTPPRDDGTREVLVLALFVAAALAAWLLPPCSSAQASASRACPAPDDAQVLDLAEALRERLRLPNGRHYVRHCREAPEGCERRVELFAAYFVEAGRLEGVDPWLLAALAVHESALFPGAESRAPFFARGIVQLHPRSRASSGVRFVRGSPAYRRRCLRRAGACQLPVVLAGARYLAAAIQRCGGELEGLGAYGSGRCGPISAARRVLRERTRLRVLTSIRPAAGAAA